jgi:hypothetical protein
MLWSKSASQWMPAWTPLRGAAIMCSAAIVTGAISDWWDEPLEHLDWDKEVIRRLVENITAAVGGISGMP